MRTRKKHPWGVRPITQKETVGILLALLVGVPMAIVGWIADQIGATAAVIIIALLAVAFLVKRT